MDLDRWWDIIEQARAAAGERADDRDPGDDPLVPALIDQLAALEPGEIIEYDSHFREVWHTANHYPLWAAAYLIEGGCGDDGFMDFRAGLILQGRTTFERALADPDSLADHAVVRRMASDESGWIGCEPMHYAARTAYERHHGDGFEAARIQLDPPAARPSGADWDFEDEEEMHHRLPRLAALFL